MTILRYLWIFTLNYIYKLHLLVFVTTKLWVCEVLYTLVYRNTIPLTSSLKITEKYLIIVRQLPEGSWMSIPWKISIWNRRWPSALHSFPLVLPQWDPSLRPRIRWLWHAWILSKWQLFSLLESEDSPNKGPIWCRERQPRLPER